jgi:ubiquinone biosynthesis protein
MPLAAAIVLWVIIGPLLAALITFLAGRLLGARRGWVSLWLSGIVGFSSAVITAGLLTDWDWDKFDMVFITIVLGTVFTMATAISLDLISPIGTLARGQAAGLVSISNPVTVTRKRIRPFRRYRQVLGLARANGVVGRNVSHDALPEGMRRTLEQAGGIFVKLGQVASTRSDVLPSAWCDELAGLRSGAEPAAEELMRPYITELLGAPPERFFTMFDWTPLASASMSQVYRATLPDDSAVVVKVLRPGLDETVELDSAAIMQIANVVERRTPLGLSVRPATLAAEFLDSVREELDLTIEAGNASALRTGLADVPGVRIPEIYPDLSGERILTEEFVDAPNVGQLVELGMPLDERRELADRLITVFMHQIFAIGVFHGDPHPGNILLDEGGMIVLIDLGAVGRLGDGNRRAVLEMLAAASVGDTGALRQALGRITIFDRRVDLRELEAAMESFVNRQARAGGGISATAFEDLAVIIGRFGIRLPPWFGTLSRTLVTLEGTIKGLDPEFSLVDAARQHVDIALGSDADGQIDVEALLREEAMAQLPRLRRLPEHVDELLGQAVTGRLSAQLSVLSDERDERLITRLADRAVLSRIATATTIASVILLNVDGGPSFGGDVSLNEVLGYFGLAAGTILAFRVVAGIIRDGET